MAENTDLNTDVTICPHCGTPGPKKIFATHRTNSGYLARTRICDECGGKWLTYEVHAKIFKRCYWTREGVKKLIEKYGSDSGYSDEKDKNPLPTF